MMPEQRPATENCKDTDTSWNSRQAEAVLARIPAGSSDREQIGALYQYTAWVMEMFQSGFEPLVESLPVQAYFVSSRNGGVEVVHKRTFLKGYGKEESEARQALEQNISSHIKEWKEHAQDVAALEASVDERINSLYTDYG